MITLPKTFQENDLRNQLENILKTKSHKEIVLFALNCAKDVKHLYNSPETNHCINLVEQWLIDPNSVSNEQLRTAAANANAYYSAYSAYYSAYSAYYSTASVNSASYAASYAANSASANDYKNHMKFYIIEVNLKLKPISNKTSPCFDLQNQEEFQIALDFIQEYYHDDLLVEENNKIYFKFYDFIKEKDLPELIKIVFNNELYTKQVTRILNRLLTECEIL